MFHYYLAFLLINTCYQSLGNPIQPSAPKQLLSKPLVTLASQCENAFLSNQLRSKIQDCAVFVPPYSKKQFQCLIFYDINKQLCSAVASSKLALNDDYLVKINEKQDVNSVCMLAKEWVFTNLTDFIDYKESAEKFFKLPATCGEVCGVEDTMNEANYYCKYYKWGLEMLKSQIVPTMANNANNNAVAAPVISEPDVNAKADIPVPINSNPIDPQNSNTKTLKGQIKQTELAIGKTTPQKVEEAIDDDVVKSDKVGQSTPKQTPSLDATENADKNEDADVNVNKIEEPPVSLLGNVIPSNDHGNKTVIITEEKPAVEQDLTVLDTGKDVGNGEQKEAVIDNPKPPKAALADPDDYAESDGNDNGGDDDGEDPGLEIKSDQDTNSNNFVRNKPEIAPVHEVDVTQKEYFPNSMSEDFSEDNDHFFPFFMTFIVLMVLLYVLYHNKSKVSKVFFGLILEGRQSGRRRNSRGHAYRRLDTLEQAMSATTAAPPSKIIY